MKTLILFPNNPDLPFNTSAAALAGVARQHGFECRALPVADGTGVDALLERVLAYQPDIVCGTMMTRDIPGFRTLFARLRRHSAAFTAVGGYHATLRPRHVAEWEGVDAIGIGEGERPLRALLEARAAGRTIRTMPGLWVRTADGFTDPLPPANPEPNIADLPPWDYSILADPTFAGDGDRRFLVVRTSRACPFACAYCTVPAWEKTNGLRDRQFVNTRPVAHVCAEVVRLCERYGPTDIEFWDPQFPFVNEWLAELADRFPVEVGLPFRALMHVRTLNPRRLEWLARAGCTQLYFGLESGDAEFRKTVLNKPCSDDDIAATIRHVKAAGISACAFVMWNLPGETRAQAERTIEMVDRIGFDHLRVNRYIPLPGTVLGDAALPTFPSTPVETFAPLPEWRGDRDRNWSAMSETDFRIVFEAFAALHNRYAESTGAGAASEREAVPSAERPTASPAGGDGLYRRPAEEVRRLSEVLGLSDGAGGSPAFRLKDAFARPEALMLILVGPDDGERTVLLRPNADARPFYARTEHCLISYEGASFSAALGDVLEHIRQRIEHVPFEQL